jgi:hypothetical protein
VTMTNEQGCGAGRLVDETEMARESFTLLNLTDSESESVPDLDLVLPAARKQNKRKVKKK